MFAHAFISFKCIYAIQNFHCLNFNSMVPNLQPGSEATILISKSVEFALILLVPQALTPGPDEDSDAEIELLDEVKVRNG